MRSPAPTFSSSCRYAPQTGFRDRFITDVGHSGLRAVRYVSQREHKLPPELRTRYRGALRDWELTDPETSETRRFRVAYIHSSEEHRETAAARERALTKAEEQLQRVKNGLGGRYYKTRKQVETRVARIITPNIEGLITTTTATRNAKPTLTWARDHDAIAAAAQTDGIYALATNLPAKRLTAGQILRDYKGQQIVERRHRDYKQTLKVRPIFLHNDDRIYALTSIIGIALLIFGLIETETPQSHSPTTSCCPACCPRTAPPNPPDATSSASSKDSALPTPTPASNSTASPTPNAASSNYSTSHHPGPNKSREC